MGGASHPSMLQESKEALEEEVEGEESAIETKREVVLLGVDELVAFIIVKHSRNKGTVTIIVIICFVHLMCIFLKFTK